MAQDKDPFPDFDYFAYRIAIRPTPSKLIAWGKLEEAERRLATYKWAEAKNDPRTPQNRVLLNDAVSAFLLTLEATLQFAKNQFVITPSTPDFDAWLAAQPENDVLLPGLRTLRHFEAHVEAKPPPRLVRLFIGGSLPDGTSETEASTDWKLPALQPADLSKLHHAPLRSVDLKDWNNLVESVDAPAIFEQGLIKLRKILEKAETVV